MFPFRSKSCKLLASLEVMAQDGELERIKKACGLVEFKSQALGDFRFALGCLPYGDLILPHRHGRAAVLTERGWEDGFKFFAGNGFDL